MESRKIPTLEEIQSFHTTPAYYWGYSTNSRGMPKYCSYSSEEDVREALRAEYDRFSRNHPHAVYQPFDGCLKPEPVERNPHMHGLRLVMKPTSFR